MSAKELMLLNCGAGKTLETLLDSRETKPILKEINPEYSLEGLMLKLKLLFWSTDANSCIIGKVPASNTLDQPGLDPGSLQSFPASGSFPMSRFFSSGGQSIGVSASASVLLMNIQG